MQSINCVVIGDAACGKTAAIRAFSTNKFDESDTSHLFDNYSACISVDDRPCQLTIWDTDASVLESPSIFNIADVFMICYDITSSTSLGTSVDNVSCYAHCPLAATLATPRSP